MISFRNWVLSTLVVFLGLYGWHKLNEPMEPQVIEFAEGYHVRWGNRFDPFVYQKVESTGQEEVRLPTGTFGVHLTEEGEKFMQLDYGWYRIDELPPDAYRRMFEGQVIFKEYREKQESAASEAVDQPAIIQR